ncbi:elongator complex protein 4 [Nematocida ausubeli]|nr:elongator complex protein 4 [Nematocida ausubeli]
MFIRKINRESERKSTGIAELDVLLGGGIRNGHILLLIQQENVRYHIGIHRIFISNGLQENDKVIHLSMDNPILSIPSADAAPSKSTSCSPKERIAWRYSTVSKISNTSAITSHTLYNMRVQHPKHNEVTNIQEIKDLQINDKNTRLSISSFMSPLWDMTEDDANNFFLSLRQKVRSTNSVCIISVPVYLLQDIMYGYFDYIVELSEPVEGLKYDGVLQCIKTETHDRHKYGVVCSSTGIRIEKIVLPPEA